MENSDRVRQIKTILLQALAQEGNKNKKLADSLAFGEKSGDIADMATREKDAFEKIGEFQRQQEKINSLHLALLRVTEGGWNGECGECGEKIPLKRIESYPTSDLCVGCQSLKEEKEKGRK
ncbi:TPA: hypothetical protein DEP58_02515 [Patescibacteria group bacterium]|nr:MAG: putative dnaK suppressor [Parcubacteria group bacterium GW2011_GWD2_42_14]HCC05157.1 hypothetical protein [Patescibacteria group bacterium]